MKYYLRITIAVLLLLTVTPLTPSKAEESESSFINSFEDDITGDGYHEYIKMQGNLLRDNSSFYQDIWIDIKSSFKKQWSISLQNGYDPQIKLIDLNHDQVFDIFYQIKKEEDNENYYYQLYTLKSGKVKSLPLPEHLYIQGEFADDFKVHIRLDPHKKPKTIDVANKKTNYIEQSLYEDNGSLRKKTAVTIKPISVLEPILISESKGYGLKSLQKIKGLEENNDDIGMIETLWYFKNNKWIVLKSEIKPSTTE